MDLQGVHETPQNRLNNSAMCMPTGGAYPTYRDQKFFSHATERMQDIRLLQFASYGKGFSWKRSGTDGFHLRIKEEGVARREEK